MMPEFADGDVIVVEPDGALKDGSFVVAQHDGEWIFRQLRAAPGAGWRLHALDPAWPDLPLADLDAVRGVVIQKAVPGRRRLTKSYV
ncbi:MAG: S24 family peptidase [Burkholderiaceae bacterium]|jgi:SOS-response transcriptional repressor LexA|nr:S24 family peptidase [Burkholderiaceae bacterium]